MFDDPPQGCNASFPLKALAAVSPNFLSAVVLDAFRLVLEPITGELLEY